MPPACSCEGHSSDNRPLVIGAEADTNLTLHYWCLHYQNSQANEFLLQTEQLEARSLLCYCLLHLKAVSWQLNDEKHNSLNTHWPESCVAIETFPSR